MAINNTNKYGSLSKYLPNKVIAGYSTLIEPLESWMYDDGDGDPWWQGSTQTPCVWRLTATITPSSHSSHLTRSPFTYNGLDIVPGMWVFSTSSAFAVRIVSIISKNESEIVCRVEDVDRYNTFKDPASAGNGIFVSSSDVIFFTLGDDGLPVLDPLPQGNIDANIISQIEARFRVFNPNNEYRFYQVGHGFNQGNVLKIDPITKKFMNATSDDIYRIGTVVSVGPGPNYFYLAPSTKFIQNLEPALPGQFGSIIWIDPTSGDLTTNPDGSKAPLYIQVSDATPAYTISAIDMPITYDGIGVSINKTLINFTGSEIIETDAIISAINQTTQLHGVVASMSAGPNVITGTGEFPSMAMVDDHIAFTVNDVLITILAPSIIFGEGSMLGWWDFIRGINEQTVKHGVYASVDPSSGLLTFENASAGAITFVNINPAESADGILTFTDSVGVAADNPPAEATRLRLSRIDGGEIVLSDIAGTFFADSGLWSVSNGNLPLALIVDSSIAATSNYIVADIGGRDSLIGIRSGDQVFVQNGKTPGEWELYVRTGMTWTLISDYDSAKTDASTMTVDVSNISPALVTMGNMSNGTRIVNVTIVVSEPFSSNASLNVGTIDVMDAVMSEDNIDLTINGSYESNTTYIYTGISDGELFVHIDSANSLTGKAKVVVSYL